MGWDSRMLRAARIEDIVRLIATRTPEEQRKWRWAILEAFPAAVVGAWRSDPSRPGEHRLEVLRVERRTLGLVKAPKNPGERAFWFHDGDADTAASVVEGMAQINGRIAKGIGVASTAGALLDVEMRTHLKAARQGLAQARAALAAGDTAGALKLLDAALAQDEPE